MCPHLKPVCIPLGGISSFQCFSCTTWLGVTGKLAESVLSPTVHISEKDVKQHQSQYWFLKNVTRDWSSPGHQDIDLNSLSATMQTIPRCYRFAIRWYLLLRSIPYVKIFSFLVSLAGYYWILKNTHSIDETLMKIHSVSKALHRNICFRPAQSQYRSDKVCLLGFCITIIKNVLSSVKKKCNTLVLLPKYPAKLHILGYCKSEVS